MKKFALAVAGLSLIAAGAQASELSFSYVDAGISVAEYSNNNDEDATEAAFRVRGSIAVGEYLYFPLALESKAADYEENDEFGDYDYSVSTLVQSIGIGGRINFLPTMSLYGDISYAYENESIDEDSDFEDYEWEASGGGHKIRIGWRFQPTPKFELNASLSRRKNQLNGDYDLDETFREILVGGQFNFTQKLAVGAELRRERLIQDIDDYKYKENKNSIGAYFRFSFN